MLVCAAVGLVLVAIGAWALPRPAGPAPGRAAAAAPATTAAPSRSVAPSRSAPATAPAANPERTPAASARSDATVVPDSGPGTYTTAKVSAPSSARSGRVYRFDVRVERGVGLAPDEVARALERTLDDPRSWRSTGRVRFSLVAAGETADLHAYVVTPGTTDRLCYPLLTRGKVSCQTGTKVVLNAKRWVLGSKAFGPDLAGYREYLANHEFGHALGHHHVGCPEAGRPAPVMLQQTKGLQGCTANPWPSVTKG